MSRHVVPNIDIPTSQKFSSFYLNKFSGLNDKNNVLNVDQQSFSQVKNLYVDENEVLTTRPALIEKDNNIKDVYLVREWLITLDFNNNLTLKHFEDVFTFPFNNDILNIVEYDEYLVFVCKQGIFPFSKNSNTFIDILDIAYLATEESVVNGKVSKDGASSKNLLNNKYIREYIYSKDSFINTNQLLNKEVTIKSDNEEFTNIVFQKNTMDGVLFNIGYTELDAKYYISSAYDENMLRPVLIKVLDDIVYVGDNNNLFVAIKNLKDATIYKVTISQDGLYIFWFTETGLYKMSTSDGSQSLLHSWDSAEYGEIEEIVDVYSIHGDRFMSIVRTDSATFAVGTNITNEDVVVFQLPADNTYKYCRLCTSGIIITTVNETGDGLIFEYSNDFTLITTIPTISVDDDIYMTDFKLEVIDILNLIYVVGNVNNEGLKFFTFTFGEIVLGDLVLTNLQTTDGEFVTGQTLSGEFRFLSNTTYYADGSYQLRQFITPLHIGNYIYALFETSLLSNVLADNIVYIEEVINREEFTPLQFENIISFNNKHFLSYKNNIYITSNNVDDDVDLFYIPEVLSIKLDQDDITAFAVVGDEMLGVFFKNKLYYCIKSTIVVSNETLYTYEKSKLTTGCNKGNNPLTTTLGDKVVYISTEGLQTLTYQDFTATTDKQTELLSYIIDTTFRKWVNNKVVKMTFWKFWLFCYSSSDNLIYILDLRTNSWWVWETTANIQKILTNDEELLILLVNGQYCSTDFTIVKDFNNITIPWLFRTQKLHFDAPNNYKRVNIINYNIQKDTFGDTTFNVKYMCYRKLLNETLDKTELLTIDKTSTFVSRINFAKVNEFQLEVTSDLTNVDLEKVSFSAMTIKYVIGGAIR